MKQLIEVSMVITGLLAAFKCVGIVAVLAGSSPHTSLFLIKQSVFAAGFASISVQLYRLQRRNREQKHEALKAKRIRTEGIWPPPPSS